MAPLHTHCTKTDAGDADQVARGRARGARPAEAPLPDPLRGRERLLHAEGARLRRARRRGAGLDQAGADGLAGQVHLSGDGRAARAAAQDEVGGAGRDSQHGRHRPALRGAPEPGKKRLCFEFSYVCPEPVLAK